MNTIEIGINKVLSKWNPIGVPPSIAEIEYTSYIPGIIQAYKANKEVYTFMVHLCTEVIGYEFNNELEIATKQASEEIEKILG
ncbi:MAG TPA: hypothetical protein VK783_14250 [Bacteroidia bacterium]|jgi:hypothetical protein|nr:hypothetical protein [Bacteroidia bacterium]